MKHGTTEDVNLTARLINGSPMLQVCTNPLVNWLSITFHCSILRQCLLMSENTIHGIGR